MTYNQKKVEQEQQNILSLYKESSFPRKLYSNGIIVFLFLRIEVLRNN